MGVRGSFIVVRDKGLTPEMHNRAVLPATATQENKIRVDVSQVWFFTYRYAYSKYPLDLGDAHTRLATRLLQLGAKEELFLLFGNLRGIGTCILFVFGP
ncbi:hypothetical protein BGZ79_001332 [Entomortierella chlamydospora]|nr:hypothetical protein BGZ79_001332 [Entomortierella chlamydospora]